MIAAGSASKTKLLVSDVRVSLLTGCFCGLIVTVCIVMAWSTRLQNTCSNITDALPFANSVVLIRSFNLCDLFVERE